MIDSEVLEQVDKVLCLGCVLRMDRIYTADIENRVFARNSVNGALEKLLGSHHLNQTAKSQEWPYVCTDTVWICGGNAGRKNDETKRWLTHSDCSVSSVERS